MNRDQKVAVIKPLQSYASNIEDIRRALSDLDDSAEARKALTMAKYEILNAIHEISWIGSDKDAAIEEYVRKHVVDDNPSAYEVEDTPAIGQNVDVKA